LILLGTCVAPIGPGRAGEPCVTVQVTVQGALPEPARKFNYGELHVLPLPASGKVSVLATPERGFDMGAGKGRPVSRLVRGGAVPPGGGRSGGRRTRGAGGRPPPRRGRRSGPGGGGGGPARSAPPRAGSEGPLLHPGPARHRRCDRAARATPAAQGRGARAAR